MPNGKHVLIIDDDTDHRHLLTWSLKRAAPGVVIKAVATLSEAIALAEGDHFDCIVLDYNLGPVSGTDTFPALRGVIGNTPVVIVTADNDQRVAVESLRLGVDDFVHKSEAIVGNTLADRVRSAIYHAEMSDRERRARERRIGRLERAAETDELTGLPNRRGILRSIADRRAQPNRRAHAAVLMIDIDNFKQVNDTWGHAVGDAVLRDVADVVGKIATHDAIAGRWGGEEFLAIKTIATAADAYAWACRIGRGVAGVVTLPDGSPVTISIGLSHGDDRLTTEQHIETADRAMYLAKADGRGCVRTDLMSTIREYAEQAGIESQDPIRNLAAFRSSVAPRFSPEQRAQAFAHAEAVAKLAEAAAEQVQLDPYAAETVRRAALCHDLGKLAMPTEVLEKQFALHAAEWELMRTHAAVSASIALELGFGQDVIDLVAAHHTPAEIRPELGSLAMLLTACDIAVAVMEDRPYAAAEDVSAVRIALASTCVTEQDRAAADVVCTILEPQGSPQRPYYAKSA